MALKVRGTCPKCSRVYDTEAPANRATRRFRCDNGDCLGVVIARRIPTAELPAVSAEPANPAPTRPRRKAVRVDGYTRSPGRPAPVPAAEPGTKKPAPTPRRDPEPRRVERPRAEPKPAPVVERRRAGRAVENDGFTPYSDLY